MTVREQLSEIAREFGLDSIDKLTIPELAAAAAARRSVEAHRNLAVARVSLKIANARLAFMLRGRP